MATPVTAPSAGATESSTKVFRITGVPNGWDKERLRSAMGEHFQSVSIQSLAPRIDGRSGQATALLAGQVHKVNPGDLKWDTDFYGMTTLFAPPREDHKLDIIVVSGLGGHAFGSFKERGGSHMWLRDSLPKDITDNITKRPMARVIVYGHRSDVANSTSIQGYSDISASLLHSLRPLAAETPTTPIMFMGHSLGGILIKQALVSIAASKTQHDTLGRLLRATRAIIFFAVPHSGMRIEALIKMADPSFNGPLISSLSCENSPALHTLRDEFKKLCDMKQNPLGDCRFFCFYETERSSTAAQDHAGKWRMNGPKVLAVSIVSARYCPQSESDDLCACDIQRSHSDIVKFSRNDADYDKVQSVLRDMAQHTISTKVANVSLDERTTECLRALWFEDMYKRSTEIKGAVEGTCIWVFEEPIYKHWIAGCRGLLWIKGNPGTGKSTLIKHMIQHFRLHYAKGTILASFFFHGRGAELERTRLGFYRSILHQLIQQVPGTLDELVNKFHENKASQGKIGTDWNWREQDLAEHLAAAIYKSHALWLFVDALDEGGARTANELIEEFTVFMKRKSASNGELHICFTSRCFPIPRITCDFELAVDERNKSDIEIFVRSGISQHSDLWEAGIADAIIDKAGGIFLWARVALDEALDLKSSERTPRQISTAIKKMPKRLEEVFKSALNSKAEEPAESLLLMHWICFAERVMSIQELRWAIVIDADRLGVGDTKKTMEGYLDDDEYIADDEAMERRIVVLSCGLAEVVTGGRVQFIHQAVKEFFLGQGLALLRCKIESETRGTAVATDEHKSGHYRLARACIQYLRMVYHSNPNAIRWWCPYKDHKKSKRPGRDVLSDVISTLSPSSLDCCVGSRFVMEATSRAGSRCRRLSSCRSLRMGLPGDDMSVAVRLDFPLVKYAEYWWQAHVITSEASGTRPEDALDYSTWPPEALFCVEPELQNLQWTSLLHLAAKCQLTAQLQAIVNGAREKQTWMDVTDVYGKTPLLLAAEEGKALAVQILVDCYSVDVNYQGSQCDTALWQAAKNGHTEVVRILLETSDIDVDLANVYKQTPLYAAVAQGHLEVVRLLVGVADLNCPDWCGSTPLLRAMEGPSSDIFELLVKTLGVDVDARDSCGVSALMVAAKSGNAKQVKLLVETGEVDINARDDKGKSALVYAADYATLVQVGSIDYATLVQVGSIDKLEEDFYPHSELYRDLEKTVFIKVADPDGHDDIVQFLLKTNQLEITEVEEKCLLAWGLADRTKE